MFGFKISHLLLDDVVDEEIHGYDMVELAFRHVAKFVVTFELLFLNYGDIKDDHCCFQVMMKIDHHWLPR